MAHGGAIRAGRVFVELFADDSKLVRGLRRAQRKLKAFGSSVRNIGLKMASLGTAIAAPFLLSAKVFGDLETQMKMVSTMLDEPERHMAAFTQGIQDLAIAVGESTESLAKGLYDLLSASIDPAQALEVLAIASRAAKGGMTDTAVAVDGLTSVLNAFGMSAEQAGHVADVMFQTIKRGKLTFPSLASNIGKVAPMARAAGMSMGDMMASIATMTRQGLSPEEATTRLVALLTAVPEQAGDIATLAQKYVGQSLAEVQVDFPEKRAASGLLALAADMAGLRKDLDLMQNAAGRADEAFVLMGSGLVEETSRTRQAVNYLAVVVGEALSPTLKKAAAWFRKGAVVIAEWAKQNKELIVVAFKMAVGLAVAGVALVALGVVITGASVVLGAFGSILAGTAASLGLMLTVMSVMVSPIGLVITAIVALGVAIIHATGAGGAALTWLVDKFKVLKDDAVASFQGISDALASGDIGAAAKILWLTLKMEWDTGINALLNAWSNFQKFLVTTYLDTWDSLLVASERGWHALEKGWIGTKGFFSRMWDKMSEVTSIPAEHLKASAQKSWNMIQGIFDETIDVKAENIAVETGKQVALSGRKDRQEGNLIRQQKKQQSELDMAAAVHEQTLATLGRENLDSRSELDAEYASKMAQNATDLAKARTAWRNAIAAAKSQREDYEMGPPASAAGGVVGQVEAAFAAVVTKLSGLADAMATARERTIGVTGTFNAASLLGLQAGGADDRIATATERAVDEIVRLQTVVKDNANKYG